jgi:macrolide transport system ATP-binding/permease protein
MNKFLREWINRLRYLGRRAPFDGELQDEVWFHLESRAAELEEAGLIHRDAQAQARREFGPVARMQENSRAAWQFRWLEDLFADLRFAFRAFSRSPGFTLTAVLSLALGIGANTAIFSAMDTVLWKPLPVADPNRLVRLVATGSNGRWTNQIWADFVRPLRSSGTFADVITLSEDGLSFSYDGRAERIVGEFVSPNFFEFLGVGPALGQPFSPGVRAGRWAPEAVLSYRYWQQRFAGDPGIIGRVIHLNRYPFTIVGVTPPSFFGITKGNDFELRIPILPDGQKLAEIAEITGEGKHRWFTLARLKPGISMARAEAAADAQFQEFVRTSTRPQVGRLQVNHLRLVPADQGWPGPLDEFRSPLFVLLALVAVVLLIACANVANMLLARATARRRELAVRVSIGAGRFRLIRQMLAESVLLSMLGGVLGIAVAFWTDRLLFHFLPQGHMSIVVDLHPDARALLFAAVLSVATGLIFGLIPAFQSTRGDMAATLKSDSAASSGEKRGARFRKLLVTFQVAFSLLLLIVAGLFVRTLGKLRPTDYHVQPEMVLLFTMKPQPELYSQDRIQTMTTELLRRVSALSGVRTAALAENGPLGTRTSNDDLQVPGGEMVRVADDSVSPGYFDAVGIPLLGGRDFTAADRKGSTPVIIVNQALARALYRNENPIGRTVLMPRQNDKPNRYEIIGVVADTHYYNVRDTPPPTAYFAGQQEEFYLPTLHVRTATARTSGVVAAIRREFDDLDKGFPVFNIKTLELRIQDSMSRERMVANLAAAFGALALVLAAVGLYGILAYSVARRTREIGIRMALGSDARSVIWLVAREALLLVGAGSLAGTLIAMSASRVLERYLFGISPADPVTLLACAGVMIAIAALAVSIPASRAARVDPLVALRYE